MTIDFSAKGDRTTGAVPVSTFTAARRRCGPFRLLAFAPLFLLGFVGCKDAPVAEPRLKDAATITTRATDGSTTVRQISAAVVELNGFVSVDVIDPSLGSGSVRLAVEAPMSSGAFTSPASVGSRIFPDTQGTTYRSKVVVGGIPREIAMLSATTLDTLAVLSNNSYWDGAKVRTSLYGVRLPSGQSISISVSRPFATGGSRTSGGNVFAGATMQRTKAFASECATRVFNILAPPLLYAQAMSPCQIAQADLALAQAGSDAAWWIGGSAIIGGTVAVVAGTASIVTSGGLATPAVLGGLWTGGMGVVGGIVAINLADRNLELRRRVRNQECGAGAKPRVTSAVPE